MNEYTYSTTMFVQPTFTGDQRSGGAAATRIAMSNSMIMITEKSVSPSSKRAFGRASKYPE